MHKYGKEHAASSHPENSICSRFQSSAQKHTRMPPPDPPLLTNYSSEVLALWSDSDEESVQKWRAEKIADFEAGGKMKTDHETMEKLEE